MINEINILDVPIDVVGDLLQGTEIFVQVEGRKHRLYLGIDGRYYYWVHRPGVCEVRALGSAE